MSFRFFVFLHFCCTIGLFWAYDSELYKSTLFDDPFQGYIVFVLYLIVSNVIFSAITPQKRRGLFCAVLDAILSYGLFTLFLYFKMLTLLYTIIIIIGVLLSVRYAKNMLYRRIPEGVDKERVMRNRRKYALHGIKLITSILFIVPMIVLTVMYAFKIPFVSFSVAPYNPDDNKEYSIGNNIESVSKIEEKYWSKLSVSERGDVLQTVINIECSYLSIDKSIELKLLPLNKPVIGQYIQGKHCVEIDYDLVADSKDGYECVCEVICHEMFHAEEYKLVIKLLDGKIDSTDTLEYEMANKFKDNFFNYQSPGKMADNIVDYYFQDVELYAEAYAQERGTHYKTAISEYISNNKSED